MHFEWIMIPYSLLTLFIVINYGLLLTALMQKIGARVGRRHGIPIWQNYLDLIKNYSIRSSVTHGVMFYLGPVFRLTGGIGLLLFVPSIFGSEMFSNLSFAGDLILALYFVFFGSLGMALGAGESGHPYAAIGVSRGLSQVTTSELAVCPGGICGGAAVPDPVGDRNRRRAAGQRAELDPVHQPARGSGSDAFVPRLDDAPAFRRRAGATGNPDRPADRVSLLLPCADADEPGDLPDRQDGGLHEPVLRRCRKLARVLPQGVPDLLVLPVRRRGLPALPGRAVDPMVPDLGNAAGHPCDNTGVKK